MIIHGLDPGPAKSALVTLHDDQSIRAEIGPNRDILDALWCEASQLINGVLVIEQIASFGMPVGAEVFETVFWSGRFAEAYARRCGVEAIRIPRMQVKMALCHSSRAKDANVRQALIDHYGGPGSIKKGGKLYKVKADEWAALAVAWTYRRSLIPPAD